MSPPYEETDGSLLPGPGGGSFHTQASVPENAPSSSGASLEETYIAADKKLLELEEELDVLLHFASSVREQRTKMAVGRLNYLDNGAIAFDVCDKFIDEYLALAAKGTAVEDMIKKLKEECAFGRSECNFLREQLHKKLHSPHLSASLRKKLRDEDGLSNGRPACGFADGKAVAERIVETENIAINVSGVVGAFGAGVSYTTIFSAVRGRLDLISWAFTCFVIVVIDCAALQMFARPPHGKLSRIYRNNYAGSVESRLELYMVLIGIPLLTGFILLGVSVGILNNQASTSDPGSMLAIQAAGFLPVAILGYFVITIIFVGLYALVIQLLPSRLRPGSKEVHERFYFPLKEKLYFLPDGPGYNHYRRKHVLGGRSVDPPIPLM